MTAPEIAHVRDEITSLTDNELAELTKLAFFWGMHPASMYETRYVFTQFADGPLYVGEGRMHWHRTPLRAQDRSVTTPKCDDPVRFRVLRPVPRTGR